MPIKSFILNLRSTYFLFCLIVILAIFLRVQGLGQYPLKGETLDEYFWTFLGSSLIQEHKPTSWSFFEHPNRSSVKIQDLGYELPIVSPNLDHPPLFALIPGSIQAYYSNSWQKPIPLEILRIPMVILALINLILFYKVLRLEFSENWSLFGMLVYAVTPTIVFANRIIIAENLILTIILSSILLLYSNLSTKKKNYGWILIGAVSILTKFTTIPFTAAFALDLYLQKRKEYLYLILGSILGSLIALAYYLHFGFNIFLETQSQQLQNRSPGFATFYLMNFLKPEIVNTLFLDGIIMLATTALFFIIFSKIQSKILNTIKIIVIFYLVFLSYSVGETTHLFNGQVNGGSIYGWYKYPLFPFLIFSLTWLIKKFYEEKNRFGYILLCLFLLTELRLFVIHTFDINIETGLPNYLIRCSLISVFLSAAVPLKYFKYVYFGMLAIFIILAIGVCLHLDPSKLILDANYLLSFV